MKTLRELLTSAQEKKVAIGHFNISDIVTLQAIIESAKELSIPVIIGTSEGESNYIGEYNASSMVNNVRAKSDQHVFLNADHTHSLEKVKVAVQAGYDAILFDGGKLPFEENIARTKEIVDYVKSQNKNILVEGELGYIGSSSKILTEIPEGAAIKEEDLTTPEEAKRFVEETGIDLLAPAVGNIHGMFKGASNPRINIERIKKIKEATGVPLVLHGGSGIVDEDFTEAITAGITIIHINTEIRSAWRMGLEKTLQEKPDEVAPYKLTADAYIKMKEVITARLRLFNTLK